MSSLRLLLRTLWHFRAVNTGIVLAAAVCTTVLAGAVIVGDSVQASLRTIVERRLGDVDHLLTAPRFFDAALAGRIARAPGFDDAFTEARPLLRTAGICVETSSGANAAQVNVYGAAFVPPGSCIVSHRLARQLGLAGPGARTAPEATIVIRMDPLQYISADLPVGRDRGRTALLRLKAAALPEAGGFEDAFAPFGSQRPVKNIWVPLAEMQRALEVPGAANMLAVSGRPGYRDAEGAARLQALLADTAGPGDYGLVFRRPGPPGPAAGGNDLVLESRDLILPGAVTDAVERVFPEAVGVLAYVVDTLRNPANGRECPYILAAGLSRLPDGPVADGAVVLNAWAADDLDTRPGDRLICSFFARDAGGLPVRHAAELAVERVIPTAGLGADDTLVPEYKMITGAVSIADWVPPRDFEFHPERIRPLDEDYWDRFHAAPRAFVSLAKAQELWRTGHGGLSSFRFAGVTEADVSRKLLPALDPASAGLVFRPIRHEQLRAAGGTTDFGQLFLGLGSFLAASAVLLVALVALLLVEQRSRQAGLLCALGFTAGRVRALLLAEGLVLSAAGGFLGAACAAGYAWLMLAGLKTVWSGAMGTTFLTLTLHGRSVAIACLAGTAVCAAAIWWSAARLGRMRIAATAAGTRPLPMWPMTTVAAGLLLAAAAASAGALAGFWSSTAGFFAGGVGLLAASLVILRRWLASAPGRRGGGPPVTLFGIGMRSAARNATRSMLTAGLLAAAAFIVVTVGAARSAGAPREAPAGPALALTFDIPLPYDLNTPEGRELLGLAGNGPWRGARFLNLHSAAGDDVSCRNLYRASNPRVTGVPADLTREPGFPFAAALDGAADPWALLDAEQPEGAIPAIADRESARWIMHKGLGDPVTVTDEQGREQVLRLVALMHRNIFQGELLVRAADFRRLFPTRAGYDQVLVTAAPGDVPALRDTLARGLADFGITVETNGERLASFAGIASAYMDAFGTLGTLGLLLGSLGLAVILVRGIAERRGEIALLYALGFPRRAVVRMLTAENGFLLACGMSAGTAAALWAMVPELAGSGRLTPAMFTPVAALALIGAAIIIILAWIGSRLVRRITPAALRQE